jgi:hydrogenase nickel incorporation protein HypA/HybF
VTKSPERGATWTIEGWGFPVHEFSIVLSVFRLIEEKVSEMGVKDGRVSKVTLKIGKLTSVIPEAMSFSFEMASKDTIFEGGRLEILEVPVTGECISCGNSFSLEEPVFLCPACESPRIRISAGRELFIDSFELQDSEDDSGTARDSEVPEGLLTG